MKIISNFKDYYDYLMGTVGIDEKVVYNRINKDYKNPVEATPIMGKLLNGRYIKPFSVEEYTLAICGVKHFAFIYDGKVYLNEDYQEIPSEHRKNLQTRSSSFNSSNYNLLRKTDLNEKHDCPVLLIKSYSWDHQDIWKNPKLADFKIGSIIEPYDMWVQIYNSFKGSL